LSTEQNDSFYRRPLDKEDGTIRFSSQPIDVNKLSTLMKNMCAEANIPGYFTNHSGKRTCATSLYQAGIPEQEIMGRTGHRSIESVRKYKRPSSEMLKDISNILEPPSEKKTKTESVDSACSEMCTNVQGQGMRFNNCVFNINQ